MTLSLRAQCNCEALSAGGGSRACAARERACPGATVRAACARVYLTLTLEDTHTAPIEIAVHTTQSPPRGRRGGRRLAASDQARRGRRRAGWRGYTISGEQRGSKWGASRAPRSSAMRREAEQQGDVGPSGAGAGASQHRTVGRLSTARLQRRPAEADPACRGGRRACDTRRGSIFPCRFPPPPPPRASIPSAAGGPRLQKSCRWRRLQSKRFSCGLRRARQAPRGQCCRGHPTEHPGWPSGASSAPWSTLPLSPFRGRRGSHRSASRCRDPPIERPERRPYQGDHVDRLGDVRSRPISRSERASNP